MNPNQPVVQTVTQQSIYSNLFSSFNVSLSTVSVICLLQKTESTCRHLKRELSEEIHRAQINCCHGYSTSECTCVKTADLQVNAGTAGILRHLCAADKKQMNPEEISADLWWTTDADLASSLCCWFCWKPECCSEGSKTWHKVQFQHPNRSSSELRPDKLFQDQSTLWFCLQTRLSTRGHCVSVSGLTHLDEGAVSSFVFINRKEKKSQKWNFMMKKFIFSEKNSLHFFSLFLFLTRIFFTWFWIENIFFVWKYNSEGKAF